MVKQTPVNTGVCRLQGVFIMNFFQWVEARCMKRRAGQSDGVENHDHEKDGSGPEDRGQDGKTPPSTPDHPAPGDSLCVRGHAQVPLVCLSAISAASC